MTLSLPSLQRDFSPQEEQNTSIWSRWRNLLWRGNTQSDDQNDQYSDDEDEESSEEEIDLAGNGFPN